MRTSNYTAKLADDKKISISNKIPQGLKCIVDTNILSTVLRNLVSNSIKFTYENGHVEINAKKEKDQIVFSVRMMA